MSTTYIANIVTLLTLVLPAFGVHVVDPGTLTAVLMQLAGVVSVLYVFYGRWRAGGISALGFYKG